MPREPAVPSSSLTLVLDLARGRVMWDKASRSSARRPQSSMTACSSTGMKCGWPTGVSLGALVRTRGPELVAIGAIRGLQKLVDETDVGVGLHCKEVTHGRRRLLGSKGSPGHFHAPTASLRPRGLKPHPIMWACVADVWCSDWDWASCQAFALVASAKNRRQGKVSGLETPRSG
eukprot:1294795-Amphidinium_carterae.3